jgi:hypothetical protein
MVTRSVAAVVWLVLIAVAFRIAPAADEGSAALVAQLLRAELRGLNPVVPALFNAMGLWPMLFACVVLLERQKVPAWPFVLGSFALGAFALLPYLVLRDPMRPLGTATGRLARLLESRGLAAALLLAAMGLWAWAVALGDFGGFLAQARGSQFLFVMSTDFLACSLLAPTVLRDDLARRNGAPGLWALGLLPLIGPACYLLLRPPRPGLPAPEV